MSPRLEVYRSPMRSRDDEVDHDEALAWAIDGGVVGVGGLLPHPTSDPDDAVEQLTAVDDRLGRRLRRFIDVEISSFVWARTPEGMRLGRVFGPWAYDASDQAARHDLPHTRACRWLDPVPDRLVPSGVADTYARGGRNFQRVHGDRVEAETKAVWERLGGRPGVTVTS